MDLTAKIALVTGGSRGVGRAICLRLADAGATVVVNYHQPEKPEFGRDNLADAREVVEIIEAGGGKAIAVEADIADRAAVEGMVTETVERQGGLDILVNN